MTDTNGTAGSSSGDARPLSPHLQVYRPQITSILSITHRLTGVALSFGAVVLVGWLAALAAGPDVFNVVHGLINTELGRTVLFGFAFALYYHLCNGIRHLAWDAGLGFELPTLRRTGLLVVAAALILTVVTFLCGYAVIGKGVFA